MINDRLTYDADQIIYLSFVFLFIHLMYLIWDLTLTIKQMFPNYLFRNVLKQLQFHREFYYAMFLHVYSLNMITIDFEYLIYERVLHL